jgi:maltokinase
MRANVEHMTETRVVIEALTGWIGHQRWFAGKGADPRLRIIGSLAWHSDPELRMTTYLILDESAAPAVLYQVPLTERRVRVDSMDRAHIATVPGESGTLWHLYDGPHDPDYARRLLQATAGGESVDGAGAAAHGVAVRGIGEHGAAAAHRLLADVRSHVSSAEQSNTSIVYTFGGEDPSSARPVICKIFRTLHAGENPDVVLQSALSAAGLSSVPAAVGSLVGEWPDDAAPSGRARGHLAFAQEFLAGAHDAWQLATTAVAAEEDFTSSARQMGVATADIHSTLASVMPTREATRVDIEGFVAGWHSRLEAAIREVPAFAALRPSIEALYAVAEHVPWPRLQRVHGDLHLGQVLAVPGGTWAIIDFEGEPLRPLADRSLLDVPLRDIAGMFRSFDYAASAGAAPEGTAWAQACRAAFIDGYLERSGAEDVRRTPVLLDAFELDKALYEAVYEARNRPSWLPIPTAAVHRLAERAEVRGD